MAISKFAGGVPRRRTFSKMKEILLGLSLCVVLVNGFNVDLENRVEYHGENNTLFGFSVAEHKAAGKGWVVIGAPEMWDHTSRSRGNYRGGSLYRCGTENNNDCIMIQQTDYQHHSENWKYDNDTRQWLGATVRSSGEDGVILACAPKYFWFRSGGNSGNARDPVGTCFISKRNSPFKNFEEYSPCRNKNNGGHGKQGSCEIGFGAAVSKDSSRLYLGAVGSYYWQGQTFSILHTHLKLPYFFEDQQITVDTQTGQLFSRSVYDNNSLASTPQRDKKEDDSYMGFSVAAIDFFQGESKSVAGVVTGIPRADQMVGKVRLMTWNLTQVKDIQGEQFASYFGYAVTVVDVDGDGADDIVVGAPMFSNYSSSKEDYEKGRVYVFYQGNALCDINDIACWEKNKFNKYNFLDGEQPKSRFGLAVASLGDINRDGFGDFAVGAPYEGLFSNCGSGLGSSITGAVYIYHGSKNGVLRKCSQVIRARDVSNINPLSTFGFSLSGGMDMDNNQYPDLVVGAYESDTVFLFKSRPVIQLTADMNFISQTKMIGLNEYKCQLKNRSPVPCVPLNLCMTYTGVGVPDTIHLAIKITLDAKKVQSPRMFFLDGAEDQNLFEERQIDLHKNGILCINKTTYIARLGNDQDKLSPLEAKLTYRLVESPYSRKGNLTPILNADDEIPWTRIATMNIKNNCGGDNICKPNLRMQVKPSVEQYILGADDLIFNVTVRNEGEDSFDTTFTMQIPPSVTYRKFEDYSKQGVITQCRPPQRDSNVTVCSIGNPLPANGEVKFSVFLDAKSNIEEPKFNFVFNVNTSNPEVSARMSNQETFISVPIIEQISLQITSQSTPTIYYNSSQYAYEKIETDNQAGPFLRHEYVIKNLGPSDVVTADVLIEWPSETTSGDNLLYLFAQPHTEGNIRCDRVPNVNHKRLQLQRSFNARYTEFGKSSQQTSTVYGSSSITGSKVTQNTGKYGQTGGASVNQISQGGRKEVNQYGSGGSFVSTSQNSNQGIYVGQDSYQGSSNTIQRGGYGGSSQQGGSQGSGNTFQQGGQRGSVNTFQQGGYGVSGNTFQQGGYQSGNTFQQGGYQSGNTFQQGGYQDSSNSGTYRGGSFQSGVQGGQWNGQNYGVNQGGYQVTSGQHGGSFQGEKNLNSIYEQESTYNKNTINENGQVNTFVDGHWRTNENGVVRNGSFSTISPVYVYNANKNSFFGSQNVPIHSGGSGSYQGVDYNTGTVIRRQQIGDDVLTTIDEGVQRGPPDVKTRGNESETVYHYRSEGTKLVKPTQLPGAVPKSWKTSPDIYENDEKRLPLLHSSQDDEGIEEDTDAGDEEDESGYDDNDESEPSKPKRAKREVDSENLKDFCTTAPCTKITCTIKHLAKNEEVSVVIPSIVWMKTIQKLGSHRPVIVGSSILVNITSLPHIRMPNVNTTYTAEIQTNITSLDYGKTDADVIPLWVVVTSACLGTLILMLLVFLLYKSGFFKRNRPPQLPERQPLNRNGGGYHMGDEAL